jgi:uncharacterized protein (TIGR02600 family)
MPALQPIMHERCRRAGTRRGVALVLVLGFITLATILVVAFLANVSSEGVAEQAAVSENTASQLAASAVQLVEGTITQATEPAGDTTYAWACQPGMIRTYGSAGGGPGAAAPGTAAASPLAYYKLYSSDNMVLSGSACDAFTQANNVYTTASTEVPAYWDKAPPLFTDLNAPLQIPAANRATGATTPVFPILDPRAFDLGVEGFSIANSYPDGTLLPSGTFAKDAGAKLPLLPMPVRWMYVLRDGTMTVPDTATPASPSSSNVTTAAWSSAAANIPAADNPIVGRIAFWTDDESAKVNINTASEGTYWDPPIANSGSPAVTFTYPQTMPLGDCTFANIQGAQHEYQRYPGHPATTCLSSVFGNALGSLGSRANIVKAITDAIPRITDRSIATAASGVSSMGGTQSTIPVTGTPAPLTTDLDRLYANLDEFQFAAPTPAASPTPTPAATATRTQQNLGTTGSASTTEQNIVDTCRFFLTAHSKAPELNMFGLPRVAMWPLWDPALNNNSTPFDNEILRCVTIGAHATPSADPHSFALFRAYPLSSTADFPTTGLPPASGAGLARNHLVYGYLHNLLSRAVPGFGHSFAAKYNTTPTGTGATDADQILTEIFDYIRCTNLADNSAVGTAQAAPYTGTSAAGSVGEVVPIQIPATAAPAPGAGTQGFGRMPTISEMVLVLAKMDDRKITSCPSGTSACPGGTNYVSAVNVSGAGISTPVDPTTQTVVEWTLMPKLFSSMCGYVGLSDNLRLRFSGNLIIGGNSFTLSSVPDCYAPGHFSTAQRDSVIGGNIGLESLIETGTPADSMYPTGLALISGVSGNSPPTNAHGAPTSSTTTMTIAGTVNVSLYAPAGPPLGNPVQTFTFTFPPATVPIPQIYTTPPPSVPGATSPFYQWFGLFRARSPAYAVTVNGANATASFVYPANANKADLGNSNGRLSNAYQNFIGGNITYASASNAGTDVVRSVVPTGGVGLINNVPVPINGDTRVVATSGSVPATAFQPVLSVPGSGAIPVNPASTTYAADAAVMGTLVYLPGNAHGALSGSIPENKYQYPPDVPPQTNGTTAGVTMPADPVAKTPSVPGDWDNGPGLMVDGPWVNKPDEGMTESAGTLPYIGGAETMTHAGAPLTTLFSPNRQVSSPVMFGSLLTGADHPWRTLLFRPAALPGYQGGYLHPGNALPASVVPDHLLLDLFWMPVVEPYGISEPFATSGKINLNYQIQPFTYITRSTGLNAVLKAVMITALNPSTSGTNDYKFVSKPSYKSDYGDTQKPASATRYPIDATQTIQQLYPSTADFNATSNFPEFSRGTHTATNPNFFVSASQICDLPLIPLGYTPATLGTFWSANSLTGDNSLERPYSMIYPRVTTKSNIFTVHVLAQSLKKLVHDANQNTWNEGIDQVTSEYHGAFTIEKYFDPNTDDITDASGNVQVASNDGSASFPATAAVRATKWRLLASKRFGQ